MDWWSIKISGQSVARVSRDIEGRKDILATRIFRRTKTFVSNKLWLILDPIVKHHQDPAVKREILSDIELKILETIGTDIYTPTSGKHGMQGLRMERVTLACPTEKPWLNSS